MAAILMVEDDQALNAGVVFDLELDGYQAKGVFTMKQALEELKANTYDLIILDGTLPDGNGFALCKKIKEISDTPVIFLTGNSNESDTLRGFELGADDYITKPFSTAVLRKRIAVVLRRGKAAGADIYKDGFLTIDFNKLQAIKDGEKLTLTPNEYKLLKLLVENANQVLTRQVILEKLWDNQGNFVDEHALTVTINRLRNKIEAPAHTYIKTVYGMGYQWAGGK